MDVLVTPTTEQSARSVKRAAALGGGDTYVTTPEAVRASKQLLPARLGYPLSFEKFEDTREMSSVGHLSLLEELGDSIDTIALNYYRENTYLGTPRMADNSDWLKGKEPLYEDLDHCLSVHNDVEIVVKEMLNYYDPRKDDDLWASMELQDLDKVTAQQWQYPGWFLQSPVTARKVPNPLPDIARKAIWRVAKRYGQVLSNIGFDKKSPQELTLLDSDPQDTMTGMPTLRAGDETHAARLAMLSAAPSPSLPPDEWVTQLDALGASLGFPEGAFYSPVTSTRKGPLRKPLTMWQFLGSGQGYIAQEKVIGLFNRVRFVFPAPYLINFILSPIYEQMSNVRKNIIGFWHDPEHQAQYLDILRKQGALPYSLDFSGMDTAMFPHIIMEMIDALIASGFCPWPLQVFKRLYPKMGIILPDANGEVGKATFIKGPARPWASGFKLTSEFDTLYGASVVLSSLADQIPDIWDRWESGNFTFLELGDDVFFTSPTTIDPERLSKFAEQTWGAGLEIIRDCMFLKWYMPVVPEIPHLTRSFARFIQQTFYNEDRYSGISGGTRPDAILRLGLSARLKGLSTHRDWTLWWPKILPIVKKLKYLSTADSAFMAGLDRGAPDLSLQDVSDIMAFSNKNPDYLDNLKERAKYEPSAATLLQILQEKGMKFDQTPGDVAIRQDYWDRFAATPTSADVEVLRSLTDPVITPRS